MLSPVLRSSLAATEAGNEAADVAVAEIRVEVTAGEARQAWVADHVSADDRAAVGVGIGEGREYGWVVTGVSGVWLVALPSGPAEVPPLGGRPGDVIDLLARTRPHVTDREPAGGRVKRESPWVPKAVAVDLVSAAVRPT